MTELETSFWKLPAFLRELEAAAGISLSGLVDSGAAFPLQDIADKIAGRYAGSGYSFGLHSDNAATLDDAALVAVRLKSGNGIIVSRDDDLYGSVDHRLGALTPIDLVMAANCMKCTLVGHYMLVRYDLIACYANPYMRTMDSIWDGYDALLCECRSTVVDLRHLDDPARAIVSLPYYKFRNLGETASYDIEHVKQAITANGGKMTATEKLDGSMVQLRYIESEDRVGGVLPDGFLYSTSGTVCHSSQAEGNSHIEALEGYLSSNRCYLRAARQHPELTFIYELVDSAADRHVVYYAPDKWGLYLTGARRVSDGRLLSHAELSALAGWYGLAMPKVVAEDIDEALEYQASGDGTVSEGMVADIGGWLVKMKLASFLELSTIYHELGGAAGFKAICRLVAEDAVDDASSSMPADLREHVLETARRLAEFDEVQQGVIEGLSAKLMAESGGNRKDYALAVRSADIPGRWQGWLFQVAFGSAPKHYWCDEKGDARRLLNQSEFEEREAALAGWLEKHGGEL